MSALSTPEGGGDTAEPANALLFFNRLKERVELGGSNRPVPGTVKVRDNPSTGPPVIINAGRVVSSSAMTGGMAASPRPPGTIHAGSNPSSNNSSGRTGAFESEYVSPIGSKNTAPVPSTPRDRKNAPYRIVQFENIINADNVDIIALRKLSWNGVPNHFRPIVWPILLGYYPLRKERREDTLRRKRLEYQELIPLHYDASHPSNFPDSEADQTSFEGKTWRQILVDLPRTSPDDPFFHQQPVRKMLERILYVWSVRHPASGYVQGMNDLLTPIILNCCQLFVEDPHKCDTATLPLNVMNTIEADSYWCFSKLMDNIQDHYTFSQPGLQRMMLRLEDLVCRLDKDLHQHFQDQEVMYIQFAFRWMNCALLRELPLQCIFRIWDTYFSEESSGFENFHVYVCLVLLQKYRDRLMTMGFQEIVTFLQNLPTEEWEEEDVEPILSQAFVFSTLFDHAPSHFVNSSSNNSNSSYNSNV